MEKRQNFEHVRGDANVMLIAITDTDGSPFDLSGASIRWRAITLGDATNTVKIQKSTDPSPGGITAIELNGASGILDGMVVVLEPADTNTLALGLYEHEAEIILNGNPRTLFQGTMRILRDIVR